MACFHFLSNILFVPLRIEYGIHPLGQNTIGLDIIMRLGLIVLASLTFLSSAYGSKSDKADAARIIDKGLVCRVDMVRGHRPGMDDPSSFVITAKESSHFDIVVGRST